MPLKWWQVWKRGQNGRKCRLSAGKQSAAVNNFTFLQFMFANICTSSAEMAAPSHFLYVLNKSIITKSLKSNFSQNFVVWYLSEIVVLHHTSIIAKIVEYWTGAWYTNTKWRVALVNLLYNQFIQIQIEKYKYNFQGKRNTKKGKSLPKVERSEWVSSRPSPSLNRSIKY